MRCELLGSVKQPWYVYPETEALADGWDSDVLLYMLRRERPPHVWLGSPAQGMLQSVALRAVLGGRDEDDEQ